MKKIIIRFIIFCLLICSIVSPVSAHVLQSDGAIGAVLHIDPDDDPVVGQVSNFFFEFKDRQQKFQPQNCLCSVTITEGGKIVYTQAVFATNAAPSLSNASFSFTFPQKDVYVVQVIGKPRFSHSFQPFTLTYPVRVAREQDRQSTTQAGNWLSVHLIHLLGGIIILIAVGFAIIQKEIAKRKNK